MTTTRIRRCGETALLLECADLAAAVRLAERIERASTAAVDVVAATRTVLVTVGSPSELPRLRAALEDLLGGRRAGSSTGFTDGFSVGAGAADERGAVSGPASGTVSGAAGSGRSTGAAGSVLLDVRYDGPDLAEVAELAGVSTEEFVHRHTSITWVAAFGGFAPGFFYLVDARELEAPSAAALPTIPRLPTPRPRVPAGSVAVADRFCAVYPGASPGGWRLLGTTDATLWDVDRPRPALLAPGTRVRFRDLGRTA